MGRLRRSARKHEAGVDYAAETYQFQTGDRVLTFDGILGMVTAVEDGFHLASEEYVVELDGDLGGGNYTASQLSRPVTAQKTADAKWVSVPKGEHRGDDDDLPYLEDDSSAYRLDTEYGSFFVSKDASSSYDTWSGTGSGASRWKVQGRGVPEDLRSLWRQVNPSLPSDTMKDAKYYVEVFLRRAAEQRGTTAQKTGKAARGDFRHSDEKTANETEGYPDPVQEQMELEPADMAEDEDIYSLASDDYPELSEILAERLPLPHSERVGSKTASVEMWDIERVSEAENAFGLDDLQLDNYGVDSDPPMTVREFVEDVRLNGIKSPIELTVEDGKVRIFDGRHRLWAAQFLGLEKVPVDVWVKTARVGSKTASQQVKIRTDREVGDDDFMVNVAALSKEGMGFWMDKFLYPLAQEMIKNQPADIRYNPETGRGPSFDWCRFRRARFCYFPNELNQAATAQAGYAVWVPLERGYCPREQWDGEEGQRNCPVGEPGPNADPSEKPRADATVAWEDGGQRYDAYGNPLRPPGR